MWNFDVFFRILAHQNYQVTPTRWSRATCVFSCLVSPKAPYPNQGVMLRISWSDSRALNTWVFPKIGVPPKWMVYNGKPYQNGRFGGTIIKGNTQMKIACCFCWLFFWWTMLCHTSFFQKKTLKPISLENSRGMSRKIWIFSTISISRIPPNDMINCKFHWG